MTDGKTPEELAEEKRKAVEDAKKKAAELRKEREARKAAEANTEEDLDLVKKKAVAAAKAKAAALRKKKELESSTATESKEEIEESAEGEDLDLAKKKAVAAAKAKAAALRKKKELASSEATELKEESEESSGEDLDLAKKKAVAAAKAKAAALKKKKESGESEVYDDKAKAAAAAKAKAAALKKKAGNENSNDEKAKAIAIAKAKAKAAAAAKAKEAKPKEPVVEEEQPSHNQPVLDRYIQIIRENLGEDLLEDAYINRLSKHVPTLVARKGAYLKLAQFLRYNELLAFDYLSETHGTDFETHMEVYNHFYSYQNNQSVALKVKLDRNEPVIDSLTSLWEGANWPEREGYDLLGITFKGHPNLTRIMMPDDWVGHPLRKDYEPYDVEV